MSSSSFQCATCSVTLDAENMMKHLSSTRHKSITDGEEVACEVCQNSNIHQLQIIRFGGEDMSLLCNACFNKEYSESERPSTAYSLSNGSILKAWSNYLRVRDCACTICGSESKLNVNSKKNVLCDSCLAKTDSGGYISEASGKFLYVFLGIKETSTKTFKKKGGRKLGRAKGKRKNTRTKKPLTVHEQMAQKAYMTKKQNSIIESDTTTSLRSFHGSKAASTTSPPSSKGKGKPTKKSNLDNKLQAKSKESNSLHKNKESVRFSASGHKTKALPNGKKENSTLKRGNNDLVAKKSGNGKQNKAVVTRAPDSRKSKRTSNSDNKTKVNSKSDRRVSSKPKPVEKKAAKNSSSTDIKLKAELVDIEEGEPIKKFSKYVARMKYPDLETYFDVFSHAMFLEQKLEVDFVQNFEIVWPKSAKENVFMIMIKERNNEEMDKLLPANLARFGRLPFANRQPIVLTTQDENQVWYTYIKEIESRKGKLNILLELYYWNKLPLPLKGTNEEFKFLPCSAQMSRVLFAMTRIKNEKFIDLILGLKPIKQLTFHNRLTFSKDTLNESQKAAIQHVLNNNVTILQGPPGTGKTSTIEEIILQLIGNFHSFPILCVAASNIAIDNIAEKFMKQRPDIKILRIVSDGKQEQYNSQHPLGKICLHNIVNSQLSDDMKDNLKKLRTGRFNEVSKNQYNKLLTQQNNISDRYVLQAQILFTTNIAAGGRQLKCIEDLPVVIMDESTQSSEAATLVPLSLPGIRKFVFVGDEKQLSSFSNVPQLEMSLFERVLLNKTYVKPHLLDTQYRMHPKISEFPILKFYDGKLKNGVTEEAKTWPGISFPLFFYHCDKGREQKVFNRQRGVAGFTYTNKHEVDAVIEILYKLILDKKVPLEEIGVISAYSAQRDLISKRLVEDTVINPNKLDMVQEMDETDLLNSRMGASNKTTINIINGLFVSTVDSFQGHEKSVIVFSCVRNNTESKIGFLSDRRRLNVALTRAKNGLVVVGNSDVLHEGDTLWRDYIEYLRKNGLVHSSLELY